VYRSVSLGGFAAARALSSRFNDEPSRASRHSIVTGMASSWRGCGILVIEELDHALARGAVRLPRSQAMARRQTHITSHPARGWRGARRAMAAALQQARLDPGDVQHLNAHATSTPAVTRVNLPRLARFSVATEHRG